MVVAQEEQVRLAVLVDRILVQQEMVPSVKAVTATFSQTAVAVAVVTMVVAVDHGLVVAVDLRIQIQEPLLQ
jgi:hypothetical protein